jgi:hypothetical protein
MNEQNLGLLKILLYSYSITFAIKIFVFSWWHWHRISHCASTLC